jgi:hypothetical protein
MEPLVASKKTPERPDRLQGFGPTLEAMWAAQYPDRRPLDPAAVWDLCDTSSVEMVAARYAAATWGIDRESVSRKYLPDARLLAATWAADRTPRPPSPMPEPPSGADDSGRARAP